MTSGEIPSFRRLGLRPAGFTDLGLVRTFGACEDATIGADRVAPGCGSARVTPAGSSSRPGSAAPRPPPSRAGTGSRSDIWRISRPAA